MGVVQMFRKTRKGKKKCEILNAIFGYKAVDYNGVWENLFK